MVHGGHPSYHAEVNTEQHRPHETGQHRPDLLEHGRRRLTRGHKETPPRPEVSPTRPGPGRKSSVATQAPRPRDQKDGTDHNEAEDTHPAEITNAPTSTPGGEGGASDEEEETEP